MTEESKQATNQEEAENKLVKNTNVQPTQENGKQKPPKAKKIRKVQPKVKKSKQAASKTVNPNISSLVCQSKRLRTTTFQFPMRGQRRVLEPNKVYQIQLLLTELKKHPSSKYLLLQESELTFNSNPQALDTRHLTLNTIVQKLNRGCYFSHHQFYLDMLRMFNRSLSYLKSGEVREHFLELQQYYSEILIRHKIDIPVNEEALVLAAQKDITLTKNKSALKKKLKNGLHRKIKKL